MKTAIYHQQTLPLVPEKERSHLVLVALHMLQSMHAVFAAAQCCYHSTHGAGCDHCGRLSTQSQVLGMAGWGLPS